MRGPWGMNLRPSSVNPKGMNGEVQPFNIDAWSKTFEPQIFKFECWTFTIDAWRMTFEPPTFNIDARRVTCRPRCINGQPLGHDLWTSEHGRWMRTLQASMKFLRCSMSGVRSWYFRVFCWKNWDCWGNGGLNMRNAIKAASLLLCSSGAQSR